MRLLSVEASSRLYVPRLPFLGRVEHGDALLVATAVERRLEPDLDDLDHALPRRQALSEREHVGVVVCARQSRRLLVPAQAAADAADAVRRHRLAVAGPAEDDAPLELAARDG